MSKMNKTQIIEDGVVYRLAEINGDPYIMVTKAVKIERFAAAVIARFNGEETGMTLDEIVAANEVAE